MEEDHDRKRAREDDDGPNGEPAAKRRRKSRWGAETDKSVVPGHMATLAPGLSPEQQDLMLKKLRIDEITKLLMTGEYVMPSSGRSPSPPPLWDAQGHRTNTREQRAKDALERERDDLCRAVLERDRLFRPPPGFSAKPRQLVRKVYIPQDEFPDVNFMGLIIGPRGSSLKKLEAKFRCKFQIRGKGSEKEGKNGLTQGAEEPLHCIIRGDNEDDVAAGVAEIERLCIPIPEDQNEMKKQQLRLLASLNGTLRDDEMLGGGQTGRGRMALGFRGPAAGPLMISGGGAPLDNDAALEAMYVDYMAAIGEMPLPRPSSIPGLEPPRAPLGIPGLDPGHNYYPGADPQPPSGDDALAEFLQEINSISSQQHVAGGAWPQQQQPQQQQQQHQQQQQRPGAGDYSAVPPPGQLWQ